METVDMQKEIDLIARRQRVFGILVREIMLTNDLDWKAAKRQLLREMARYSLYKRMNNLKTEKE